MRCKTCHNDLDATAFYVSNRRECKACVRARVKAHRQANLERVRSYDRMRAAQPHRVAARLEYQESRAFSQSHAAAAKRWAGKNIGKRAAQVTLGNAVRDGRVQPWPVCEVPECGSKPEAHHPHYGSPLTVTWLCSEHHKQAHALLKDAA